MLKVASVALLLFVPIIARADSAPTPGYRWVWVDFIFMVERDYPDYEFYVFSEMPSAAPEQLPLTPSHSVRVSGLGPDADTRYKSAATVYALKRSLLAELTGPPSREWFQKNRDELVRLEGNLNSRAALPFTDNRDRIEITYRIEVGPDGGRLVKVGENAGDPWVKRGWIAAAVFVSLGIVGPGLRWVRRRRHLAS